MSLRFDNFKLLIAQERRLLAQGEIKNSERIVLLGPSGCGKTTFLRAIAGLHPFLSGHIFLDTKDISHSAPQDRNIGFVFQSAALFPHLNVIKNVCFGLDFHSKFRDLSPELKYQRGIDFLKRVGLESFAQKDVNTLSGGERQRVALIRSLIIEPQLLLLDEPLSALDSDMREELQNWLLQIFAKNPQPVLIVTHDKAEAEKLGTKICEWPKNWKQEEICLNF